MGVCLSVRLSVCPSVCQSVCLSVCPHPSSSRQPSISSESFIFCSIYCFIDIGSCGHSNLTIVLALLLASCFETLSHETHSVMLNVFTLKRLNTSYHSSRFSSKQRKKS